MKVADLKDWVQLAVGTLTVGGTLIALFSWVANSLPIEVVSLAAFGTVVVISTWVNSTGRASLRKQIAGLQAGLQSELTLNGGKSIKAAVNRIETKLDRVSAGLNFSFSLRDEAVWQADEAGRCVMASPALCELFGMTEQEMLGSGWLAAIDSQAERETVGEAWSKSIEQRIPWSQTFIIRNKHKPGRIVVESRSHPFYGDGTPLWYYGTCEIRHQFTTQETLVHTAIPGLTSEIMEKVLESRGY